jgi:hypothetical protein
MFAGAYGSGPTHCHPAGGRINSSTAAIDVHCWSPAGTRVDSQYTAFVLGGA